jgi:hypothetical protein
LATSTTRLGLTKPDGTDLVDIAVLNTNFDKTDAAVGAFVCTSTTRPSTPYAGQIIYETDTDQSFVWDSATSTWNVLVPGATICTSASRPASPVPGQIIYETDTKLTYAYASGAWDPVINEKAVSPFINRTNFFINGSFDIWQRGTTAVTVNGNYSADRWIIGSTAGTNSVTRSTDVPTASGAQYSISFAGTSTTDPLIRQKIEAQNAIQFAGQTVTLSFYAKSTAGSAPIKVNTAFPTTTADTFGTWASPTTTGDQSALAVTPTGNAAASWTRYSVSFAVSANAVRGYQIDLYRESTTTSTTTLITGAQLEIGAVASPFRRNAPSIQAELAVCQRYFQAIGGDGTVQAFGFGVTYTTSAGQIIINFKQKMRAVPVFSSTALSGIQVDLAGVVGVPILTLTAAAISSSTDVIPLTVTWTANGNFGGHKVIALYANNSLATRLYFDAEL